jgi:tetratricopeptide (TPR) repeat protein
VQTLLRLCVVLGLLASTHVACAAGTTDQEALTAARAHFEAGSAMFKAHLYTEAIREFAVGYRASRKALFLLNLGLSYTELNDIETARKLYERFLREAPASETHRSEAEAQIRRIEDILRSPQGPPPIAPNTPPLPSLDDSTPINLTPPTIDKPPVGTNVLVTTQTVEQTPQPQQHKFWRHYWWVVPLSLAVVGTAVGLGVYYGTRSSCDQSAGCFSFR